MLAMRIARGSLDMAAGCLTSNLKVSHSVDMTSHCDGRQESPLSVEDKEEETVQWTVMGVVSCIPIINWTVWKPTCCISQRESLLTCHSERLATRHAQRIVCHQARHCWHDRRGCLPP